MRTSVFEYDAFVKGLFSKMFAILATVITIRVYQQTSKKEKSLVLFTHKQNIICSQAQSQTRSQTSQTQFDDIAHEQTITCRQLSAGHVAGFRPMKRKKNLHRIINRFSIVMRKVVSSNRYFFNLLGKNLCPYC